MRAASSLSVLTVSSFDNTGYEMKRNEATFGNVVNSSYDSSAIFRVNKGLSSNSVGTNQLRYTGSNLSISTENGLNRILPETEFPFQMARTNNQLTNQMTVPLMRPKFGPPRKTVSLTDAFSEDSSNPGFSGWGNGLDMREAEWREVTIVREPTVLSQVSDLNKSVSEFSNSGSSGLGPSISEVPLASQAPTSNRLSQTSNTTSDDLWQQDKVQVQKHIPETKNGQGLQNEIVAPNSVSKISQRNRVPSNTMKILKARLPGDVSTDIMLNAALEVRAELEKDPKFRSRADSLKNNRFPVKTSQPGNYKQSPSFMHLQGYLLNSKSVLQPPRVSSTFTPEKVHNLFSSAADVSLTQVPSKAQSSLLTADSHLSKTPKFLESVKATGLPSEEKARVMPVIIQTENSNAIKYNDAENLEQVTKQSSSGEKVHVTPNQDFKKIKRVITVINETSNFKQPGVAPVVTVSSAGVVPPPSILVKTNGSSENGLKPVKKVAFQCDADLVQKRKNSEFTVDRKCDTKGKKVI